MTTEFPSAETVLELSLQAEQEAGLNASGKRTAHPNREVVATLWQRLSFTYIVDVLERGSQRFLEFEDLQEMVPDDTAAASTEQFQKNWQAALQSGEPVSLAGVILKTWRTRYLVATLLSCSFALFLGLGPLVLKYIVLCINFPDRYSLTFALGMCAWLLFPTIIGTFAIQNSDHLMCRLALRMRGALVSSVYEKSFRLSARAKLRWTTGEIGNLIAVDAQRMNDYAFFINWVWSCPILFTCATVLLAFETGWAFLPGMVACSISVFLSFQIAARMVGDEKERTTQSGKRMKVFEEIITAIRVLKLYSWEAFFAAKLQEKRDAELTSLSSIYTYKAWGQTLTTATDYIVAILIISVYVSTSNDPDRSSPAKIFTILGVLQSIRIPLIILPTLIPAFTQLHRSVKRVESFLLEEERDAGYIVYKPVVDTEDCCIQVSQGQFAWHTTEAEEETTTDTTTDIVVAAAAAVEVETKEVEKDPSSVFALEGLNFSVQHGELVMIVGKTGAGKSSVVEMLLGNMTAGLESKVTIAMKQRKVAFVSQTAWILNNTVRNNIIVDQQETDEKRYQECVDVCALRDDFDTLVHGDATEIGERGHNLSGGQKQRLSLARAVYSDAELYIMDDPLAAVDATVASHIFNKCINGVLREQGKTRVLVTNQLQFLEYASTILVLDEGRIVQKGTLMELASQPDYATSTLALLMAQYADIQAQLQDQNSLTTDPAAAEQQEEKGLLTTLTTATAAATTTTTATATVAAYRDLIADGAFQLFTESDCKDTGVTLKQVLVLVTGEGKAARLVVRCVETQVDLLEQPLDQLQSISASRTVAGTQRTLLDEYAATHPDTNKLLTSRLLSLEFAGAAQGETDSTTFRWVLYAGTGGMVRATILALQALLQEKEWQDHHQSLNQVDQKKAKSMLVEDELRITGSPGWSIYQRYFTYTLGAVGLLSFFVLECGAHAFTDIWLNLWTSQTCADCNYTFYLWGFAVCVAIYTVIIAGARLLFADFVMKTVKTLHQNMLFSVLHAPVHFFDATPVGRIVSRFSRDIDIIDMLLPMNITDIYFGAEHLIIAVGISIYAIPYVGIAFILLTLIYVKVQSYYRQTARELQRLESIFRSPLLSHVIETLNGDVTVRAFNLTTQFQKRLLHLLDANSTTLYVQRVVERWLAIRLESIGGLIGVLTALISVVFTYSTYRTMTEQELAWSAGFTGLALGYGLSLPGMFNWLVRQAIEFETRMNAVERVVEYTDIISEEANAALAGRATRVLRKHWPSQGVVEIKNLTLSYLPTLPPALRNVSLNISHKQKVGVVGRTGAGKSTLLSALFRLVEIPYGTIFIDGVDIRTLKLCELRPQLTIIPQDPRLFRGTVRTNVDIENTHTDAQVQDAVERAQLNTIGNINIHSEIQQGGTNFSHGMRQLVCLARAILLSSKILILDEATSSVDSQTDTIIQEAIRTHFADATVISIAHRINTIMDCDLIVVMDYGRVVEQGSVEQLTGDPNSYFAKLVQDSLHEKNTTDA